MPWRFRGGVCWLSDDERWHVTIAVDDNHTILDPGFATEQEALDAYATLRPSILKELGVKDG